MSLTGTFCGGTKHKHKFYPTNNFKPIKGFEHCYEEGVYERDIRQWVCECGEIKWVKEKK